MRLLIAEDEKSLSRALAAILTRNNYSVDTVYDGEAALEYLEATNYDGLILDVMMPKMDGITVLKTLRARGNTTPVLILSAKSEIDDKVLGLDSGANDYLTKPFDAKELLARIRAITRIQNTGTSSQTTYGNITLDCATYELSSSSGSFKLANREFQMMELLISNPTHLIPTQRFLEKSGDMTVMWRSMWYGCISPIFAKNWMPSALRSRSKPSVTPGIFWRKKHDSKITEKTDRGINGITVYCSFLYLWICRDPELSENGLGCRSYAVYSGR